MSQNLFANNNNGLYRRRQTSAAIFDDQPPTIVVSDVQNPRRPSYAHLAGHNRRRISTVALKKNFVSNVINHNNVLMMN